jgi:hypothetical protein
VLTSVRLIKKEEVGLLRYRRERMVTCRETYSPDAPVRPSLEPFLPKWQEGNRSHYVCSVMHNVLLRSLREKFRKRERATLRKCNNIFS